MQQKKVHVKLPKVHQQTVRNMATLTNNTGMSARRSSVLVSGFLKSYLDRIPHPSDDPDSQIVDAPREDVYKARLKLSARNLALIQAYAAENEMTFQKAFLALLDLSIEEMSAKPDYIIAYILREP